MHIIILYSYDIYDMLEMICWRSFVIKTKYAATNSNPQKEFIRNFSGIHCIFNNHEYLINHNRHNKFLLKTRRSNNIFNFDYNKTSSTYHIS